MPPDNLRQRVSHLLLVYNRFSQLRVISSQGIQVYRPIIYGNMARMLTPEEKHRAPPEHTHQWTVALRSAASYPTNGEAEGDIVGGKDDLSHFIKRVTFKLHESFPNPSRGA